MVQLVNPAIITKTNKMAAENAAVIWTSDSTELGKVKKVKMCVSGELPVVAFQSHRRSVPRVLHFQ